ncbi:protein kinase domain-containing protein [Nocardioides pacificus]
MGELFDGRYELEAEVGSGGTGSVHRARDTVLGRTVAVKLLRAGGGDDEMQRARLRAEAQLAGALQHPGVAQIFDLGEDSTSEPSTPYIVMQYVEGVALSDVLRQRRTLPPHEVLEIIEQVAGALAAAHASGIIHRDLKPANMLFTPDRRVVLVDFGIARSESVDPITLTGTIVGTVDYISPEQTSGQQATTRSDLYSLGVVAYECLTGLRPFRRDSQVATALAHINDEVPPLGEEVPASLRELVMALLAKDPAERPRGAVVVAELAAGLLGRELTEPVADEAPIGGPDTMRVLPLGDAALADHTGESAPDASGQVAPGREPRRRRMVLATGVVAALLALIGAVALVGAGSASRVVPDVTDMTVQDAARQLEDSELDVTREVVDDPLAAAGMVLRQSPGAGDEVDEGTVVRLTVASGRVTVRAGQVVGLPYTRAVKRLERLSLVAERREVVSTEPPGRVLSAEPTGHLPVGSTVTLTVAVAEPAVSPARQSSEPGGAAPQAPATGGSAAGRGGGGATAGSGGGSAGPSAGAGGPGNGKGQGPGRNKGKGQGRR